MIDQFNSLLNRLSPHAHWLLRSGFAAVFLFHGLGKVATFSQFAKMMDLSVPVAALVTFAEIAAGIGIILGALKNELITRLAAAAGIPVLLGAIVLVHGPRWSFVPSEGYPLGGMEFQVILLLIAIYFLIAGNRQAPAN